jgi:hypothetical protein
MRRRKRAKMRGARATAMKTTKKRMPMKKARATHSS